VNTEHRIDIEQMTLATYRVWFREAILTEASQSPELDACRALVAKGVVGRLICYRVGRTTPCLVITDIALGAGLEAKNGGFRPYRCKHTDAAWAVIGD
jgi:hypothetical protein